MVPRRLMVLFLTVVLYLYIPLTVIAQDQKRDFSVVFQPSIDACDQTSALDTQCWEVKRCFKSRAFITGTCGKGKEDLRAEFKAEPVKIREKLSTTVV